MSKLAAPEIIEAVELLGLTLGTGLVSSTGIYLEDLGLTAVTGGELKLGAWFLGMGLVALYIGVYLLGYETLRPRLFGDGSSNGDAA
ncbi:hypothetical protein SAMN05192561_10814 [Halopenitus malekzadehii]|uniref:DUF8151 domain-containing protein n=1 Tax=Halopenitus malekzadehii TaxID=1267564 RepID=A0A1H6J4S0_9EURY|nr:hypothetical protein [Halopenitus malekzadehii]SEH56898.1 hypothetical protein SAMN05192561_10814 [Halopenitus malekzadehii]